MNGNGTAKQKIATKETAAVMRSAVLRSVRRPIRITASVTIATTAAWIPNSSPATHVTDPYTAYVAASASIATKPGMTNSEPAITPARDAVHQPPDVRRQLLRLRAGQDHAVVQRVQEPPLADPAAALDELAVHHGDLTSRAAEGVQPDMRPDPRSLAQADAVPGRCDRLAGLAAHMTPVRTSRRHHA